MFPGILAWKVVSLLGILKIYIGTRSEIREGIRDVTRIGLPTVAVLVGSCEHGQSIQFGPIDCLELGKSNWQGCLLLKLSGRSTATAPEAPLARPEFLVQRPFRTAHRSSDCNHVIKEKGSHLLHNVFPFRVHIHSLLGTSRLNSIVVVAVNIGHAYSRPPIIDG